MRRLVFLLLCLCLCGISAHAAFWTKYMAPDKSFSLHYPAGWKLAAEGSTLVIDNPNTGEQLLMIGTAAPRGQSAQDMGVKIVATLREQVPSLQLTQWNDVSRAGDSAFADFSYQEEGKPYTGHMLVAVADNVTLAFIYSAADAIYSRLRAKAIMDGFINSFEGDANSQLPQVTIPDLDTGRLDRNARAFIFALEFGCGTAFTEAQEKLVREEVIAAWRELPASERAQYDQYPLLMKTILALNQEQMASVQADLRKSVQEILAQSGTNRAIKVIRDQLNKSGQVLIAGTPALTAAAADAYAELLGYALALSRDPGAGPEHIRDADVSRIRGELLAAWKGFGEPDKRAVLGSPALWMALRMTFRQGSAEEKQRFRQSLSKLVAAQAPAQTTPAKPAAGAATRPGSSSSGGGSGSLAASYLRHQTMMAIQQQTFNHYMWSRGFSGWTPMGKMW